MAEATYQISVHRKVVDTYEVKGDSTHDAAVQLGIALATGDGVQPTSTHELSRKIMRPIALDDTDRYAGPEQETTT